MYGMDSRDIPWVELNIAASPAPFSVRTLNSGNLLPVINVRNSQVSVVQLVKL